MRYSIIILILLTLFFFGCQRHGDDNQKIRFDKDGMLVRNGQRLFMLGAVQLPDVKNPYQELAKTGFNLVQSRNTTGALDSIQQAGLLAWLRLDTLEAQNFENSKARTTQQIQSLKNHPALLFWENWEEPARAPKVTPQTLKKGYDLLKSLDRDHPVFINHGPTHISATLRMYNPACDFVGCNIFPVNEPKTLVLPQLNTDGYHGDMINPYISQIGTYVDKMLIVAKDKKTVFMTLQAFAWESFRENGPVDSLIRYPTHHELRFMAYQAIIHGATGLNFWGLHLTPVSHPFYQDLKNVVSELASIQPILSAPTRHMHLVKIYHELGHSVDLGVEVIIKKSGDFYYILAVNADKNPIKVSISGFGREDLAEILFENRRVKIKDRELTDYFEPFDTHIYKLHDEK